MTCSGIGAHLEQERRGYSLFTRRNLLLNRTTCFHGGRFGNQGRAGQLCGLRTGKAGHQRRRARHGTVDPVISAKLAFALRTLAENGKLTGTRTRRVSARVDPGLVEAARIKTGLNNDSELINAALAVIAAPDDFGPWFAAQAGRLPKDFELEP